MALARQRNDGKGASLFEIVGGGVMWFCPWYYDPADPNDGIDREQALAALAKDPNASWFLSIHYWRDWSLKRAPISVLCPNGREWCVDQKSSNGTGWTVVGDAPDLIVTPSIDVPGYHGFLGSNGAPPGHFSGPLGS